MGMELPIFELLISENEESNLQVDMVSLVDKPAIEKNFMAFNEQKQNFALNNEQRIVSGPAMLANVPIFRKGDKDMADHLVVFKPETIMQIAQKFFSKGFNNNFNIMHNPNVKADDVFVFESFIVDSKRGILPMAGYEDAQDGSWFISAKINNPDVWEMVKEGQLKGFSVEGLFNYKKNKMSSEEAFNQIVQILKNIE